MMIKRLCGGIFVGCMFFSALSANQAPDQLSVLLGRVQEMENLILELQTRISRLEDELKEKRHVLTDSNSEAIKPVNKSRAVVKERPNSFNVYWKEGIRGTSADKRFAFKTGGRLMNDWAFMSGEDAIRTQVENLTDGTEFRQARIYFSGRINDNVEFKTQFDFANGKPAFKDAYIGLINLPGIGRLRVGHFKEPFSLEELTSSKYTTFMERALPNALSPSRNAGIMLHSHQLKERITWSLGIFRQADSFANGSSDGDYDFTGRFTGLPWYTDSGRNLLHLGLAYSRRSPQDENFRVKQRPETHLAPQFLDTGNLQVNSLDLLGMEAALVLGSVSLQTEFIHSVAETSSSQNLSFSGWYVQGSYFFSGEHRRYSRKEAAFSRVKPKRSFLGRSGGVGAWEVALRYSFIDLSDSILNGGRLEDFTLGLNWHLNTNTKVMWNYVLADIDSVGDSNILQMRFQVDF